MDYADAKQQLQSPDPDVRARLAGNERARPEMLYLLAEDRDDQVRSAAAGNPATPIQIAPKLARDGHVNVRSSLARKLGRALPDLDAGQRVELMAIAIEAVRTLAEDEVAAVRRTLATSLRDVACVPSDIALSLASDVEQEIAEPIIRFSAGLSETDLLQLLAARPEPWVSEAVARRARVEPDVCRAVYGCRHQPASRLLIDNEGADIPQETLAEMAEDPALAPALKRRHGLPERLRERIHALVDEAVFDRLAAAPELEAGDLATVEEVARRRLTSIEERPASETIGQRVRRLAAEGRLNDAAVSDAIGLGEREFAVRALALLAGAPVTVIATILDSGSARAITALFWHAGLSMRTALQAQRLLAHLPPSRQLPAREGTDYPLSESELRFQLEFLGLISEDASPQA